MPLVPMSTRIREAMKSANPALEDTGGSLGLQTEGASANQAVLIQQLQQENLDIMEIHALENDLAAIERDGEVIDELSHAVDEVTELKADLEHYRESGGLTARDAVHISHRLKTFEKRYGFGIPMPAVESFRGSASDRITLTAALEDSSDNIFVRAWKVLKDFFNKMWEKVKGWFGKAKDKAEETSKRLEDVLKRMSGTYKLDDLKTFKQFIGEKLWYELGDTFTASAMSQKIAAVATNTKDAIGQMKGKSQNLSNLNTTIEEMAKKLTIDGTYEGVKNLAVKANGSLKEAYRRSAGLKTNVSVSADPDDSNTSFAESSILIGGTIIVYKEITSKDENGADKVDFKVETKKAEKGENQTNDPKPEDNAKIEASTLKSNLDGVHDVLKDMIYIMDKDKSTSERTLALLDKSPEFPENTSDADKKKFSATIDTYKKVLKLTTQPPALSALQNILASVNSVVNTIEKAEKAAASDNG